MPETAAVAAERVAAVRAFNRFYTRRVGALAEGLLRTPYPLPEARVLFELGRREVTDTGALRRALAVTQPSGGTAIYDAVLQSLPVMATRSRQRAAILVISDGADTASTATLRDVRTSLLRSDAFVYAVAIDSPEPQPINTRVNAQALREITSESGGRTEIVQSSADLEAATSRIAEELSSQYVLGYNSSHRADGKFHSIRVRVAGVDYRVRSRNGYVATPR